jgi:hypothetical protein
LGDGLLAGEGKPKNINQQKRRTPYETNNTTVARSWFNADYCDVCPAEGTCTIVLEPGGIFCGDGVLIHRCSEFRQPQYHWELHNRMLAQGKQRKWFLSVGEQGDCFFVQRIRSLNR